MRWNWHEQRQKINDLRTRELPNVSKYGSTQRDDQLRQAMDRLYETRGRAFSRDDDSIPELQRSALMVESDTLLAVPENDNRNSVVDSFVDLPVLPPGVINIRQAPRRPGAPSAALPH